MREFLLGCLRPHRIGLVLAQLALLFGFGFGVVFGAAEARLKQGLHDSAQLALVERYQGDAAKAKAVVDKSFAYYKRAHLHGGALGAAALALITLLALLSPATRVARGASLLVGAGSLGYPIFWLVAGASAPGLGGTGAAKEAFAWLGLPTSGAVVTGSLVAVVLITRALVSKPEAGEQARSSHQ